MSTKGDKANDLPEVPLRDKIGNPDDQGWASLDMQVVRI